MRNTSTLILFAFGALLVLYPTSLFLYAGLALLVLVAVVNLLRKDPITRTKWIFGTIFFLMASVITVYAWRTTGVLPSDSLLERMPYRLWSLAVGFGASFIATLVMFAVTIYVSGIYVLGLKDIEGLTGWHAFKSIASLIFNTQYDWIVVSDGKIVKTRPKGVLKELGGPGKVIINTGNAVIFERAGKITQIRGAGVVKTRNVENIRQVFDLRKQFAIETFDTITADKITVTVELGIGYRILPAYHEKSSASELIKNASLPIPLFLSLQSPGSRLVTDSSNQYPVSEATLRNAAFNNTAGGWHGIAVGSVSSAIRDQIMAQTVEDLFDVTIVGAATPAARTVGRATSVIEEEVKTQVNIFAHGNGIEITVVDIRSIKLPQSMEDALAKTILIRADQEAMEALSEIRKASHISLLRMIADTLGLTAPYESEQIENIVSLMKALNKTKPEQIMDHERFDVLRKMAESDGTKIINTGSNSPLESPISIDR